MTPLFRWVGGKGRLLGTLRRFLPKEPPKRYYEPFLGGGALFFAWGHEATECYLSDTCGPLMLAYEQLQENYDRVREELTGLEDHITYNEMRDMFNTSKSCSFPNKPFGAALFIALNHMCFNGVYRENKKGYFNVPAGRKGPKAIATDITLATLNTEHLFKGAALLTDVQQTCCSFLNQRLPQSWPLPGLGSVKFYDPPYLAEYSQYNQEGFGEKEHKQLALQAQMEAEHGALVIVCNSNNELTHSIFGKPTHVVQVNRTVGNSLRGSATEAIYTYGKYTST